MDKKTSWMFIMAVNILFLVGVYSSSFATNYDKVSTGGTASASDYRSSSSTPAKAFDSSTSTSWCAGDEGYTYPSSWHEWLRYKLSSSRVVTKYRILAMTGDATMYFTPNDWTFQGSHNGSTWVTLDTQTNVGWTTDTWKTFTFSNTTAYRYYRIYITDCIYFYYSWYYYYYIYARINELELYSPSLPGANFSAATSPINIGDSSTLNWSTTNATSVSINQGVGSVSSSGSFSVSPIAPTEYTLTVVGVGSTITRKTTVDVYSPTVGMEAVSSFSPPVVMSGDPLSLNWYATNVTMVKITNNINSDVVTVYSDSSGIDSVNGSVAVNPVVSNTCSVTYTITATSPKGTATKNVSMTVYADETDSDEDGLPDWYEVYGFGNLTSHGLSSGDCDCD